MAGRKNNKNKTNIRRESFAISTRLFYTILNGQYSKWIILSQYNPNIKY